MSSRMERLESAIGASGAGPRRPPPPPPPPSRPPPPRTSTRSARTSPGSTRRRRIGPRRPSRTTARNTGTSCRRYWRSATTSIASARRISSVVWRMRASPSARSKSARRSDGARRRRRRSRRDARCWTPRRDARDGRGDGDPRTSHAGTRRTRGEASRGVRGEDGGARTRRSRRAPSRRRRRVRGQLNDILARLARLENDDAGEGSKTSPLVRVARGCGSRPVPVAVVVLPVEIGGARGAGVAHSRLRAGRPRVRARRRDGGPRAAAAPPPNPTNPSSASDPRPDASPGANVVASSPPRHRFDPRALRFRPRFGIYARGSRGWRAPTFRARWTGPAPWKPPPPPRSRR